MAIHVSLKSLASINEGDYAKPASHDIASDTIARINSMTGQSTMRILEISLVICSLSFAFASAVLADDPVTSNNSNAKSSPSASVPKRVLGTVIGTFVGTPICAVRRIAYNEKYGLHGMIGDADNKLAIVSAGAFWMPFSVVIGAVEAPCYSFKHSLCNNDKPFSKEQFSLGNDVD
jgi:hypothetical protein